MKKHNLPQDKQIKNDNELTICELSFKTITDLLNNNKLKTPIYQIDINQDRVNEMVNSYKKNPLLWSFKKNIVLGYFYIEDANLSNNYNIYLLDGQHRLDMAKELHEIGIEGSLYFYYYHIKTNDELRDLFISINKDSFKNSPYVNIPELEQKKDYEKIKQQLSKDYSCFFSKKASEKNQLYTISEFINILQNKQVNFNLNKIIESNKKFNGLVQYTTLKIQDSEQFYKDEKDILDKIEYLTIGFKNNNWIDYYITSNNIIPAHIKFKKQKEKINPKLRKQVWEKEFGNLTEAKCPIKLCKNIIFIDRKNGFHCGHIISEKNNGATDITNLRPICASCNCQMSSTNWTDYELFII